MDSAWCWSSQHGVGDIYLPLLTYTGTSTSNIRALCYVRHACYAKHPLGAVMVSESIFRSMSFFQSLTNMVMEEIKKYSCFNLEMWSVVLQNMSSGCNRNTFPSRASIMFHLPTETGSSVSRVIISLLFLLFTYRPHWVWSPHLAPDQWKETSSDTEKQLQTCSFFSVIASDTAACTADSSAGLGLISTKKIRFLGVPDVCVQLKRGEVWASPLRSRHR